MECREAKQKIQDLIDGRLPPEGAAEMRDHLEACGPCGAEEAELAQVGEILRLWSAARVGEREPQLAAMWTRVRAGIGEREDPWYAPVLRRWIWIPAGAALVVFALLFYPFDETRAPFHPKSFDVTVESLESDTATVALVDKGEELPRVIWIIENGKT